MTPHWGQSPKVLLAVVRRLIWVCHMSNQPWCHTCAKLIQVFWYRGDCENVSAVKFDAFGLRHTFYSLLTGLHSCQETNISPSRSNVFQSLRLVIVIYLSFWGPFVWNTFLQTAYGLLVISTLVYSLKIIRWATSKHSHLAFFSPVRACRNQEYFTHTHLACERNAPSIEFWCLLKTQLILWSVAEPWITQQSCLFGALFFMQLDSLYGTWTRFSVISSGE